MDPTHASWNYYRLREMQQQLDHLKRAPAQLNPFDTAEEDIGKLQAEVAALRLQVNLLMNLLVGKGITTDEEIKNLIQSMIQEVEAAKPSSEPNPFGDLR